MRAAPRTSDTPIRQSRWRRSRPSRTWTTTQRWGWRLARTVAGCGGTEATSQTTSWTEGKVTVYGVFGGAGTGIVDCNEAVLKGKDFQQLQWFKDIRLLYLCSYPFIYLKWQWLSHLIPKGCEMCSLHLAPSYWNQWAAVLPRPNDLTPLSTTLMYRGVGVEVSSAVSAFPPRLCVAAPLLLYAYFTYLQVELPLWAPAEEDAGQKGAHRLPGRAGGLCTFLQLPRPASKPNSPGLWAGLQPAQAALQGRGRRLGPP